MKKQLIFKVLIALTLVFSMLFGSTLASAEPWKFAIMADTQWPVADDGKNPNSVAVDIINQLNREFTLKGVTFVVAVGDITDNGSNLALDTRVTYTQALYNAGIGFFPLRGNHESSATAAAEFVKIFPQTQNGLNNSTPAAVFVTTADDARTHPVEKLGFPFVIGSKFSSPNASLKGLSYSFTYDNATFVLLDMFTPADGSVNTIEMQQTWITNVLKNRPQETHAFVFSHKGLITESHVDTLFGSNPATNPAGKDAFITSLFNNGVRYYFGGHDHMHNRSVLSTSDGKTAEVQAIVCASDSAKFYTPVNPTNDQKYNVAAFGRSLQTQIAQDLYQIGYYIVTVDGHRVTVDYYGVPAVPSLALPLAPNAEVTIVTAPQLSGKFQKRDSFGYSLNGKEFLVLQGQSYSIVRDSFNNTTAKILSGINQSTATDFNGRSFAKDVATGWSHKECDTNSPVLSLWGMASSLGSQQTDVYALSMSYDPHHVNTSELRSGLFGLAIKDANGKWINAVAKNFGGTEKFVYGPWTASYELGTYGVDPGTHTAWAVINHSAKFAIASFTESDMRHDECRGNERFDHKHHF
jgi:hypothetical protein